MRERRKMFGRWHTQETEERLKEMRKELSSKIGHPLKQEDFAKYLVQNSDWIVEIIAENVQNDT